MGGLLILMYQGQARDPHLRNIVTVASPISKPIPAAGGRTTTSYSLLLTPKVRPECAAATRFTETL